MQTSQTSNYPVKYPTATIFSKDGHICLGYKGEIDTRLIMWGDYMLWERFWTNQQIHDYCKYFATETPFNGFRIFLISNFSKSNIENLNLIHQSIFEGPNYNSSIYDLYHLDQDFLVYIQKFCKIAATFGLVVQVVLYEHCGFKPPSWNFSPFNPANSNARYGWSRDSYFPACDCTVFTDLCSIYQNIVCQVVNAIGPQGNIIWELSNEGDPVINPPAYRHFFEKLMIPSIKQQSINSNCNIPVFADSSSEAFLGRTMNNEGGLQWMHNHLENTGWSGMSTDGDRIYNHNSEDLILRYQYIKATQKHFEMHLTFIAERILGQAPMHSFLWGTRQATVQDYRDNLQVYFDAIKNYVV